MIRPFTLITALLPAGSGAYLFAVKHRAQTLDNQFAAITQQSRADEQRIRVLQAQWALEIDPTRLSQLSSKFTTLQPMKPAQLVTLASLQENLPQPGSVVPGANPEDNAPVMPLTVPDAAGAGAPVADAAPGQSLPLPPDAPPMQLASAMAPAGPVAGAAAKPAHVVRAATHSSLHMASSSRVAALPPPKPLYEAEATPRNYVATPVTARTVPGRTVPMGAQVMSVKAMSSAPVSEQSSGSVLGMATNLPPPQPFSGGTGN